MSEHEATFTRRGLLRSGLGGAVGAATLSATGGAFAQAEPYDGYLSDASNFDGTTVDRRGESEVTVAVGAQGNNGAFAFAPPAVQVDPGTTVVWEWTGEGGQHNVVSEGGAFESELVGEAGHTFEYTFEESGVFKYFCQPHKGLGMKGVVAVGDTAQGQAGGEGAGDRSGGGGGGGGEGGGSEDGGSEAGGEGAGEQPETAANELAAQTLLAMLALAFLSPIVFLLIARRRMGSPPRRN